MSVEAVAPRLAHGRRDYLIRSATVNAAKLVQSALPAPVGVIEPDALADLIVVEDNPLRSRSIKPQLIKTISRSPSTVERRTGAILRGKIAAVWPV
ncbi:MAG: hypothetical protein AB7G08_04620 [Hyphomicrobiaceae bacterium]